MNTHFDFGAMASDKVRSSAYVRAIKAALGPQDTVLDLGCGSGIYSVLAAKLGAKKVIAIDPNPAINYGPMLAKRNGVSDKIDFIQGMSSGLSLEEPVDLIFSDLRGALPLYKRNLPSVKDAAERLLKYGGVLIPHKDLIFAAPVRDERVKKKLRNPWFENSLGVDLSPIGHLEMNRQWQTRLFEHDLCCPPQVWGEIDYRDITDFSFGRELNWVFESAGEMTGIAVWFETTLFKNVTLSNHPAKPAAIYAQTLFPVKPFNYRVGQKLCLKLEAKFLQDAYIWSWMVTVTSTAGEQLHQAKHCTISQNYLSPEVVRL